MKKFTLFLLVVPLLFSGFLKAQVIEDFEGPKFDLYSTDSANDKSSFSLVANPDPSGINTSNTVLKFYRDKNIWYTGFKGPVIPFYNDGTQYYHAKVWKPRISPTTVGFYTNLHGYLYGNGPINPQAKTNQWEELVFNFKEKLSASALIFLVEDMGSDPLTEDIVIYVDDIYMNHDPAVGSKPEVVFADFEHIPLNLMLGGAEDKSSMAVSPNPGKDNSEVNLSSHVIKFTREKDGVPWGGFWSKLPEPIDVTTNKYIHVKVWKPRISPVKFKIEGGAAGNLEIESKYPQTKINEWEDMVFDFSSKTGTYPIIAFMPDFEDPVTLTEDIVIYFDDIVLNNDPTPRKVSEVTINVDMTDAGLTPGHKVFINGNFGGVYGNWVQYGSNPACEMTDPDNDGIYSIKMKLPDETFSFSFYKGKTGVVWEQDSGPSNRKCDVKGNTELTYKWQLGGLKVTEETPKIQVFNVDMKNAGLQAGQKVYIAGNFGGVYGNWAEPGTNPQNELTDPDGDGVFSAALHLPDGDYQFKFFKGSGWGGGEWPGDPNRSIKATGSKQMLFDWGVQGIKYLLDGFNLITDGDFEPGNPLLGAWGDISTLPENYSDVKNGALEITTNKAGDYNTVGVFQRINDFGKLLQNDSVYILKFDAWADKEKMNRFIIMDNGTNSETRLGISKDPDAVAGTSEWDIRLTTEKITYTRTFTAKNIKTNSSFLFLIWSGAEKGTVYIDNVYLFKMSDLKNYGEQVASISVTVEGSATAINTDKGTLQMKAEILPQSAWVKDLTWSVINVTGNAVIDEYGLLTAVTNGVVTVKATANDGSGVTGMAGITITNQKTPKFPLDFENIYNGAWNIFGNGIQTVGVVKNPSLSSTNKTLNSLKLTVAKDAGEFAGAASNAFEPFKFSCDTFTISLMVRKAEISAVGVKLENSTDGGPDTLVTIKNSVTNAWQNLRFNFPSAAGYTYKTIKIYPDMRDSRAEGTTVYVDEIKLIKTSSTILPTSAACKNVYTRGLTNGVIFVYPNPVTDFLHVRLNTNNGKLAIYNSLGSKLDEITVQETLITIDVRKYARGVYFLKTDNNTVFKFVK